MHATVQSEALPERILDEDGRIVSELPEEDPVWLQGILKHMLRVRCVDQRMMKLQRAGRIGFVGSMRGQEAAMIGTAAALEARDWLWSGLREGGAALMRGLPLREYVAQMFCNSNDTAKGRQMCNHPQHKPTHYPSWSSVIGTQIPHGVGAALAAKLRGLDEVHAIYFGDGATSSNGFHSGLNLAGVWRVPAVFCCVDNGWAISVPSSEQSGQRDYAKKAAAYGLPGYSVDGNDVLACFNAMRMLVGRARREHAPALLVVRTYRMEGHSSSDDPSRYRDPREVEEWKRRDPIDRYAKFLVSRGLVSEDDISATERELYDEIDRVIHEEEAAPPMPLRSLVEDVYADVPRHLRRQYNDFLRVQARHGSAQRGEGEFPL